METFCTILVFIGFFICVGSVGSMEVGNIDIPQCLLQSFLGFLCIIPIMILHIRKEKKDDRYTRK